MHPDGPCGVPGCSFCELHLVEPDDKIGGLEVFVEEMQAGNPLSICDNNGGRVNIYTNDEGHITGVIGLQRGTVLDALGAFDAEVLLEVLSDV